MLNETFYIDGVDARNFGIYLQKPIEFSEAVPVVERQSIPGRNGDLIFETGSYENRTGTASCFCLQKDVEKAISAAGRFLMGKHGYRRLETSDDPDHFWLARVENSPQIMQRMRTLAPFEITFDCKPQRFLKSGEIPIVFSQKEDIAVDFLFDLYNPFGFSAKPLVHIKGSNIQIFRFTNTSDSGDVRFVDVLNNDLEIDSIYIDCDTQNVYNETENLNKYVSVKNDDFPIFYPGKNAVSVFGLYVFEVEITPRWWEL